MDDDIFGFEKYRASVYEPNYLPIIQMEDEPRYENNQAEEVGAIAAEWIEVVRANKRKICLSVAAAMGVLFLGNVVVASQSDELNKLRAHSLGIAGNAIALLAATTGVLVFGRSDDA